MRLAHRIEITLAGEVIVLHPALRHAINLERRPGSFKQLLHDVQDESLSAACAIIDMHYPDPLLPQWIFDAGLDRLKGPLTDYILHCAGIDPEARPSANDNARDKRPSVPFRDHLARLYRIGTGWLGWTPQDTLDATPTEIMQAYEGRMEMLRAIFGGSEETAAKPDPRSLDDKFKALFATFGTTTVPQPKAG